MNMKKAFSFLIALIAVIPIMAQNDDTKSFSNPRGIDERHATFAIYDVRGVKLKMIYVPGNTFKMGKGDNSFSAEVTGGYYLSETEVTNELWNAVMRDNYETPNWPIEVKWLQAVDFCNRLKNLTGIHFRLPTEAEWENAARFMNGEQRFSGSNDLMDTWNTIGRKSKPEAKNMPNFLKIYGMSNGVGEWCSDIYRERFPTAPQMNYEGPESCEDGCGGHCKVVRASGDLTFQNLAEVTARGMDKDYIANNGIRVALSHKDYRDQAVAQYTNFPKMPVRIPAGLLGKRYGRMQYATGIFDLFLAKERFPVEAVDNKPGYGYLVKRNLQGCPEEFFLITKAVPVGNNAVNLTLMSNTNNLTMTMKLTYFANTKTTTVSASNDLFNNIFVTKKP